MAFAVNQTKKSSTVKAADQAATKSGFNSILSDMPFELPDNRSNSFDNNGVPNSFTGLAADNPIGQLAVANATSGNVVSNPSIANLFGTLSALAAFGAPVNPISGVLSAANFGGNRGISGAIGPESEITDIPAEVVSQAAQSFGTPHGFNASGLSMGPNSTGLSSTGVGFGNIGQSPDLNIASGKYGFGVALGPRVNDPIDAAPSTNPPDAPTGLPEGEPDGGATSGGVAGVGSTGAPAGEPDGGVASGGTGPGGSSGGTGGVGDGGGPGSGAPGDGPYHQGGQVPGSGDRNIQVQGGETVVPKGPFADLIAELMGKSTISKNYIDPRQLAALHGKALGDAQPKMDPVSMLLQGITNMLGNSGALYIEQGKGNSDSKESPTTAGGPQQSVQQQQMEGSPSQMGMHQISQTLNKFAGSRTDGSQRQGSRGGFVRG